MLGAWCYRVPRLVLLGHGRSRPPWPCPLPAQSSRLRLLACPYPIGIPDIRCVCILALVNPCLHLIHSLLASPSCGFPFAWPLPYIPLAGPCWSLPPPALPLSVLCFPSTGSPSYSMFLSAEPAPWLSASAVVPPLHPALHTLCACPSCMLCPSSLAVRLEALVCPRANVSPHPPKKKKK